MYLERKSLRKVVRFLIFGSVLTLVIGIVMILFSGWLMEQIGLAGTNTFFVKLSGLLLSLFAIAYIMTLLERESSKDILILGFFQKLLSSFLIVYATLIHQLPVTFYSIALFDFLMAALFGMYVRSHRSDDWL